MSDDIAIKVENLSKCYHIYDQPRDRLKQMILPRLQSVVGLQPKKYFREFWALKDVSFEIKKGETVGIIGRNGSGKSTLLQMICGTLNPTSGGIQTHGRIAALLELGSGFNPEFTGRENVYLNGSVLGLSKEEIDSRFDEIAAFADIGEFIEQPVKTYSSGMVVRLAFATQAYVYPDVLIVDEALAVGDVNFVHKCMHHFHYMQERGTTIVLVSHDATAIKTLCNRAIWIDQGELQAISMSSLVVDQYLASIVNLPVVMNFGDGQTGNEEGMRVLPINGCEAGECNIPNIDRRTGDQSFSFVGVGLYDLQMRRTSVFSNRSTVLLRMTLRNHRLDEGRLMVLGYSLRNNRGVDIASNNSEIEGTEIRAPAPGRTLTIKTSIDLPEFHPGSYSISISIGYRLNDEGRMQNTDGITNAVIFDITANRTVHVLMSLNTTYEVETI